MCVGDKAEGFFKSWLRDWYFFSSNSEGLSRGLLTAWRSSFKCTFSTPISSGLVVELRDHVLKFSFKVVNLYGPYVDHIPFWEGLASSGVLQGGNIVLGGT
jgi:hypothetical protein